MRESLKYYFIVFAASACILILEIVAARVLAPIIGVSLYTWTSIIGIVLAGISVGNYLGGVIADKYPSPRTLGFVLLSGGLFSLGILPILNVVSDVLETLPLMARVIFLTSSLFLLPSLILGMVTPVVIRLMLDKLEDAGKIVGKIYAISTVGSIFGTFITGFFLIQWIGTRAIILLVACVLVLMSVVFGQLWKCKSRGIMGGLILLVAFLGLLAFTYSTGAWESKFIYESNYYSISVHEQATRSRNVKMIKLDKLVHGYISPDDPTHIGYDYERIIIDFENYISHRKPDFKMLVLGGGGYSLPRYTEEVYPDSKVEVVEIDPMVTRVAHEHMGLKTDTKIMTYHTDARIAVRDLPRGQYDLILGDVFHGISIPYHLTTKEFNEDIKKLLGEEGIYAVNVIDLLNIGKFLRAFTYTLQQTFPYVYILRIDIRRSGHHRETFVVAASPKPLTYELLKKAHDEAGLKPPENHFMTDAEMTYLLKSDDPLMLTDDFVPVDNILYDVHSRPAVISEAYVNFNDGIELMNKGQLHEAIECFTTAINIDPNLDWAYLNRGISYGNQGKQDLALKDFTAAIEINPRFYKAFNNRGNIYTKVGKDELALSDYNAALSLARLTLEDAPLYVNRGNVHYRLSQYHKAIDDFTESINLNPEFDLAYKRRGDAHYQLKIFRKAIADYSEAIQINPEYLTAYRNRSKAYHRQAMFKEAIGDYTLMMPLDPKNAMIYNDRGEAYVELGNYKNALSDYNQAVEINPYQAITYANRAIVNTVIGSHKKALSDLARATELGIDVSGVSVKMEKIKASIRGI